MNWSTFEALANQRGLSADVTKEMRKRFDNWKKEVDGLSKKIRNSEVITEDDLAIRINVKDRD